MYFPLFLYVCSLFQLYKFLHFSNTETYIHYGTYFGLFCLYLFTLKCIRAGVFMLCGVCVLLCFYFTYMRKTNFFGCLFFVRLNNAFLFEDFSNLFEFFHIFFKIFQISVCQHTNFASSQTHNKCNTCVHTNFLCVLVFAYFSGPYQKMQCKKISAHAVFYCTFYFSSFIHAWPLKKLQAFTSVATTKLTRK